MTLRRLVALLALLTFAAAGLVFVLLQRDSVLLQSDNIVVKSQDGPRRVVVPVDSAHSLPPPAPPVALPFADGPRSEFPEKPEGTAKAMVVPPDFADTLFSAESEEDPAWFALEERITEARDMFSEEGLAILQPMLTHPSARVRAEAMDAILQMELPAAGKVLREAARLTSSNVERRQLNQAAEYNDLPSASAEQIRKMRLWKTTNPISHQ
jgi:hypothetical protein